MIAAAAAIATITQTSSRWVAAASSAAVISAVSPGSGMPMLSRPTSANTAA